MARNKYLVNANGYRSAMIFLNRRTDAKGWMTYSCSYIPIKECCSIKVSQQHIDYEQWKHSEVCSDIAYWCPLNLLSTALKWRVSKVKVMLRSLLSTLTANPHSKYLLPWTLNHDCFVELVRKVAGKKSATFKHSCLCTDV